MVSSRSFLARGLLLCVCTLLLSACGQKGPLYLPQSDLNSSTTSAN